MLWETPIMETSVTTLDSRRRGVFPPPFQPGDVLAKVGQSQEAITFQIVRPGDVPVAKTLRRGGFTMLDTVPLAPERIAAAIRAERDSR